MTWGFCEIGAILASAFGVGIGMWTDSIGFALVQIVTVFWIWRARKLRIAAAAINPT